MIKNLYLYLRFYFLKLFTSKYRIKGKCNCCGACCRNIVFMIEDNYVTNEEQFEKLKEFDKKYYHFEISGKSSRREKNGQHVLLFRCKSLDENNRCRDYFFRSIYCREYPKVTDKIKLGGCETFDTCGYEIEIDKKFKEYLE